MKARELRINNWANYKGYDVQISIEDFLEMDKGHLLDFLKPIDLNEEWLLKFGFKKDNDDCWLIDKCLYWLDSGFLQIAMGITPIMNCPCKHVHQLQNLYFALTQEELIIK